MALARILASEALLAAVALCLVEGVLLVLLGERVPPRVAVFTFGGELALAWLSFALVLGAIACTPGLRRALATPLRRQVLLLLGIPLFAGASWLAITIHKHFIAQAWLAWIAVCALGAFAIVKLLERRRLSARGVSGLPLRLLAMSAVCLGGLSAIREIAGVSGEQTHPVALSALYAGLGLLTAALCLGVRPRAAREPRGFPAGLGAVLVAPVVLAACAAVWSDSRDDRPWRDAPAPREAAATLPDRLNLLLISIDTLRSDHVSAYGYSRVTTPHLDKLAAQGVMFETVVSASPWTLPSHSALLTSRYAGDLDSFRVQGEPSLATLLRERGYRTAAFTGGYLMSQSYFGEGFDFYADDYEDAYVYGVSPIFLQTALRARRGAGHLELGFAPLNPLNAWRGRDDSKRSIWAGPRPAADAAARWLKDQGHDGPFFLFFHTYGPHEYYLNTEEIREAAEGWAPDYKGWFRGNNLLYGRMFPRDPATVDYLVALYDGGIRVTDAAVGEVLRTLEEEGLAGRTLVVVTSDHGEGLRPDLGRVWHQKRLHDDLLRVPLVIRLPERIPPALRVSTQVSAVDVLPTILDLLSCPPLPQARGSSLVPLFDSSAAPVTGFREFAFSEVAEHVPAPQASSVRTPRYKFIRTRGVGGGEFYDLARDPGELEKLAPAHPGLNDYRELLDRFEAGLTGGAAELDEETADQLRALGYIHDR